MVVRFYQSCSSPPRLALLLLLFLLLLLLLLHHLCIHFQVHFCHFHVHFRLANCSPAGPQLQGSERTGYCWPSTWDLPSSVSTAGPQPGTFPAQCAPLDLKGQIERQKRCQIECQIEGQKICQIKCLEICQIECRKIFQIEC